MPLNKANQRTFHRRLYAGQMQTVTLLKRGDDQQQGRVLTYALYECRRERITRSGEPIQGDIGADQQTVWQIPRTELDRNGIRYLNAADRIVDSSGRYWQAEATTEIEIRLFEDQIFVHCVRIDPPNQQTTEGSFGGVRTG